MEGPVRKVAENIIRKSTDFSEAVKVLLRLSKEQSFEANEVAELFEALIDTYDPRVPGESPEEFDLRKRESATEFRVSSRNFIISEKNRFVKNKIESGNRFLREKNYRRAYFDFNDAIFAVEVSSSEFEGFETKGRRSLYLDLKMKQIECLLLDSQYKKASIYSNHMLHWMVTMASKGVGGCHPDKYALLQIWLGEAEIALGNYHRAIDGCSLAIKKFCELKSSSVEKSIFNVRQTFFERLVEFHESGCDKDEEDEDEDEVVRDRKSAKIIVDPKENRGVNQNHQFIVNDLQSALRIAREDDVIFLENGSYSGSKSKSSNKVILEIRKPVTIIGRSTSKTSISGSLIKWGKKGVVTFKRLKLEIGEDIDSDDDVYLMEGTTHFDGCVLESPVNTAIYLISAANHHDETSVSFKHCILDGLESCRRMICFQGPKPVLSVDSCYICDMYSFCTVIDNSQVSSAVLMIVDSVLCDIQDGLKVIVHHDSDVKVHIFGCQMDLVLNDPDSPSHGFSLTGGSAVLHHNYIYSNHLDAVGFSLHSLHSADISTNLIEITGETTRGLGLGKGIVLSEDSEVTITSTEVIGARLGFAVSNQFHEMNNILIRESSAKSCALGFCVRTDVVSNNNSNSINNNIEDLNYKVTLSQCSFDTCHYGVMFESPRAQVTLTECSFFDVPKPLLLGRENLMRINLRNNEYRLTRDYLSLRTGDEEDNETGEAEEQQRQKKNILLQKMFLYFATKENLPHRIAYDTHKYLLISDPSEEADFVEKYNSFRNTSFQPQDI